MNYPARSAGVTKHMRPHEVLHQALQAAERPSRPVHKTRADTPGYVKRHRMHGSGKPLLRGACSAGAEPVFALSQAQVWWTILLAGAAAAGVGWRVPGAGAHGARRPRQLWPLPLCRQSPHPAAQAVGRMQVLREACPNESSLGSAVCAIQPTPSLSRAQNVGIVAHPEHDMGVVSIVCCNI